MSFTTAAQARARKTEILDIELPAVRAAISNIISKGVREYRLDTGQSMQHVQNLGIKELREYKNELEDELRRIENYLRGRTNAKPAW